MADPLVAVPAYHLPEGRVVRWNTGGYAVPERYVFALRRAGLSPVLLPGPAPGDAEGTLAPFAGLLLVGGGDVNPGCYGAEPHPTTYGVDPSRDGLELELLAAAVRLGLPTLAICRGLQIANVAAGGTLHQHLPSLEGRDAHGDPTKGRSVIHSVDVDPESRLGAALQARRLQACVSHHHQAVDRIGAGLVPVAWSHDGVVEALELPPEASWLVAVQWHPEASAAEDPAQQAIFDSFASRVRHTADAERMRR